MGGKEGFYLTERNPPKKEFMYVDIGRDFVGVSLHVLLDGARGSHNHRDCCCFEPPNSLNLDFFVFFVLVSFSVVLTEVLVSRGRAMLMRSQVLSFLFLSTMSGQLAAMVLSV